MFIFFKTNILGLAARLPRSILPVRIFNLGDKSEDVFGSRDNGALPRSLWAASRKHRGLFVLNLSPLSKSMPKINSGFYGRAAGGAQLNALYMSFYASRSRGGDASVGGDFIIFGIVQQVTESGRVQSGRTENM